MDGRLPDVADADAPVTGSSAGSADNALRLVSMLGDQRPLRVTDVSRHLGVARSTAHRLLQILQSHDFVEQDNETRTYRVGPALVALSISLARGHDLATLARPVMADLVDELGETVHLSVLRGTDIVFLESVVTERAVRVGGRAGMARPAYATAAGRVLLSEVDLEEVHRLFPRERLEPLTPRTVSTRSRLDELLAAARETGYAASMGESEAEVATVAAPVRNSRGRVVSAIAIAAPLSRFDEARIPDIAASLTRAAERLSRLLPL